MQQSDSIVGKNTGSGAKGSGFLSLLTLPSMCTGKLPNTSETQFLHLQNGMIT